MRRFLLALPCGLKLSAPARGRGALNTGRCGDASESSLFSSSLLPAAVAVAPLRVAAAPPDPVFAALAPPNVEHPTCLGLALSVLRTVQND